MASDRAYRQCRRCVMDTTDPDVVFDARDRCNHCTEYLSGRTGPGVLRHAGADAVAAEIRAAGRRTAYDCVLGVSGGLDSCYAALALKRLGLRALLVHMDNGWDSPGAVLNIRRLVDALGFDYESVVLDWDEFRDLQLAFLRASVVEAETPTDMAIQGALHRAAARHGVRYVVSAGNRATEGILPARWHYNARDARYLRAVHRRFGTRPLRRFPAYGLREEAYYKFVRVIKTVYLLEYEAYDKTRAAAAVARELGWEPHGGKHHESLYTKFVQSYLLPVKFDIDYRKATLSSMICAGLTTREAALDALLSPRYDVQCLDEDLTYVAKRLGVQRAELDAIVTAPPKSYRDYPNREQVLARLYRLHGWAASRGWIPRGP